MLLPVSVFTLNSTLLRFLFHAGESFVLAQRLTVSRHNLDLHRWFAWKSIKAYPLGLKIVGDDCHCWLRTNRLLHCSHTAPTGL